jgi:hypothetical protein
MHQLRRETSIALALAGLPLSTTGLEKKPGGELLCRGSDADDDGTPPSCLLSTAN